MTVKQKPCTLATKHKWEFVRNVTITKAMYGAKGGYARISLRGIYKCACGGERIGNSQDVKGGA